MTLDDHIADLVRKEVATTDITWPPYPRPIMGAGRWRKVISILRRYDTVESRKLAARLERVIGEQAKEIVSQREKP